MLSYKRQLHRALSDASTLRSQRTAYEVRLSRVELAWNALVSEADLILPSTSSSPATDDRDRAASPPLTAVDALDDEALDALLAHRSAATKTLLGRLQSLHPSSSSSSSSTADDLSDKCRALLAESSQSREALRVLRQEHDDVLAQLDAAHTALVRAERKFDRFQSATVAALEGRADPRAAAAAMRAAAGGGSATPQQVSAGASPLPNGLTKGEASSSAGGPAPDTGDPPLLDGGGGQGDASAEVEHLRALVDKRGEELEEVRRERVALKLEIDQLKGKVRPHARPARSPLNHTELTLLVSRSSSICPKTSSPRRLSSAPCSSTCSTSRQSTRRRRATRTARQRRRTNCARRWSRSGRLQWCVLLSRLRLPTRSVLTLLSNSVLAA